MTFIAEDNYFIYTVLPCVMPFDISRMMNLEITYRAAIFAFLSIVVKNLFPELFPSFIHKLLFIRKRSTHIYYRIPLFLSFLFDSDFYSSFTFFPQLSKVFILSLFIYYLLFLFSFFSAVFVSFLSNLQEVIYLDIVFNQLLY